MIKKGDKRGLSGIVTALILIVLVLVAAGIVWAVYNSLIKGSAEDTEFNSKCLGVSLDVTKLSCDADGCSASLERGLGSNQEFDGLEYAFANSTDTLDWETSVGNIPVKKAISTIYMNDTTQTDEVQIRIYFVKTDETNYYCSPAIVYEKP